MAKFLAFSGSNRKDATNQKTVDCIASALKKTGGQVSEITLNPQPIYNGDEESALGLPEETIRFQALLREHDAFVVGCPEYNGFMTPLLLNHIDWATRSSEAIPDLSCFKDKVVMVTSASPGAMGGMRASTYLKTMLAGIGCIIFPENFMIPASFSAFDESGTLKDEGLKARADQTAQNFYKFTKKFTD